MVDVITEEIAEDASVTQGGDGLIDATQNVIMNAAENVSEALGVAGKTAVSEVSELPFYAETEFWVGMAFVLSVCVLLKPLGTYIYQSMQNRINKVISDIDEAAKLRDDAQNLLADYQRRFINAEKEAGQIVESSRKNMQKIKERELTKLKTDLDNKEKEANRRIAAANTKAAEEINAFAGTASVELAKKAINAYLQNADKSRLIDEAIADLDKFAKAK
jgi:F-type H+-transporting ATPase subunit b